ncbi:hypothetical protein GCM10027074_30210 [Streptomyces deserti]
MGALAASVALVVWGGSSASAGGPTSALVVSPGSGETASLHNNDTEYRELERLLGPLGGAGTRTKPPEAVLEASHRINVTWLIHDVEPWRVDQVYVGNDSGGNVWIHTTSKPTESFDGLWHRARQPVPLRDLLTELGVMGEATHEDGSGSGVAPVPAQTDGARSSAAGPAASATGTRAAAAEDGTDWWWALPGAAAGAGLALVLRPLAARMARTRRERAAEPRQDVLDA